MTARANTMNIYQCWYRGIKGYGCKIQEGNWMFVPDLGQPDTRTHKKLELADLHFVNRFEKEYETRVEARYSRYPLRRLLRHIVIREKKSATVYGQLLLS